jgi:hypothetical protein
MDKKVCLSLPGRILTNVETTEQVSKGEVKFTIRQAIRDTFDLVHQWRELVEVFQRLLYAKTTSGPLRETHEPGVQSFGVWLEPPVRNKFVRPRENLLGK